MRKKRRLLRTLTRARETPQKNMEKEEIEIRLAAIDKLLTSYTQWFNDKMRQRLTAQKILLLSLEEDTAPKTRQFN